ncbi:MAG: hypothetical protein Q7O66_03850, partial [Dehalococcoidia bacterium]|nr:hypothetical protein [Dehalococcoidia bacterium]
MVLYCVFWVPGLIANIAYLAAANADARVAGADPHGKGCLEIMLVMLVIGPALIILLVVFLSAIAGR